MAFSTQSAVSDGTLVTLQLTIKYIDQADVTVFINDVEQVEGVNYTWATANSIQFTVAVPIGQVVLLVRRTQLAEPLHVFADGAVFNNSTMDENFEQLLFVAQEAQEGSQLTDIFNDVNMHDNTFFNLSPAVLPTSPVTLEQMQDFAFDSAAILRQDLANPSTASPAKGVSMVIGSIRAVTSLSQLRALDKTAPGITAELLGSPGLPFRLDLADTTSADDGIGVIVATDGGRWKRPVPQQGTWVTLSQFGAVQGGNATAAFIAAAEYLLGQFNPGGTILVDGTYTVTAGAVNFWNILAAEQGITPATDFLPSGDLVRGTFLGLQGLGYNYSRLNVTGAGDAFTWGNFTAINNKRAMSHRVDGIEFRGPGAVGHTSQVIIAGAQGFSTITTASAGTTNTNTRCLVFQECVPTASVTNCRFRYFQEAVHQTYGFGFVADGNTIQYCNIGYFFDAGVTTWDVRSGNEVEVCAVGVFSKNTANGKIGAAVIEANLAGCDVLVWVSKYLDIGCGTWGEGSPQNLVLRGDLTAPSLPNSGITIRDAVGLNVHSNGGLVNFRAVGCAMNTLGEHFALNSGEQFRNVVYDNCTLNEGPFNLASITLDGANFKDITVLGPTINGAIADFPVRPPLSKKGVTVTSSNTAVKGFALNVANMETTARLEIVGYKRSSAAADMQMQTQRYVGVVQRFFNGATVVQFSTTESMTSAHTSTGANAPVNVATPSVVVTGGTGATQNVEFRFPTGTSTSSTAWNFWEVTVHNESDAVTFE